MWPVGILGRMKNVQKRLRGTRELLDDVAPNLFRHRKAALLRDGRSRREDQVIAALETADRKDADGKSRDWLDST